MTIEYVISDTDRCLVLEDKSKPPLEVDLSSVITKVDAIRHMFRLTGLPKEATLGIADRTHSDDPFVKLTGHVGCPANADKELQDAVKRMVGYIYPYGNGQGVLDILKYFVTLRM